MAGKMQKLELTWTGEEDSPRLEPCIRLEFADDPHGEDAPLHCHEAMLSICHGLRCQCSNILFQWLPAPENAFAAPAGPAQDFWFSLDENSIRLTPELEKAPGALRLAEIIRTELTEPDRLKLREWFLATKLAVIESTPVADIDIANLPDADHGEMIGFVDVFPCGLALNFTWNDEEWAADEQYCVQPECPCKETVLSFLKLREASGQRNTFIKDSPALRYNYASERARAMKPGPAGSSFLHGLLAALKREHADLNAQLRLRHLIMQSLYARHDLERAKARLLAQTTNPLKIGRNEPCACGSGRKYKHCCLNKPRS